MPNPIAETAFKEGLQMTLTDQEKWLINLLRKKQFGSLVVKLKDFKIVHVEDNTSHKPPGEKENLTDTEWLDNVKKRNRGL